MAIRKLHSEFEFSETKDFQAFIITALTDKFGII